MVKQPPPTCLFFPLQTMQNWQNYFILSNPALLENLDRHSGCKISKGESGYRSIDRLHSREELFQNTRCETAFSCCFKTNLDPNRCKNWIVNFNMLIYINTRLCWMQDRLWNLLKLVAISIPQPQGSRWCSTYSPHILKKKTSPGLGECLCL